MSLSKFTTIIEEAIEAIEPNTLSAHTRYKDLKAWDSLAILTVTDAIDMEYGVLLGKQHFESAETVEALYLQNIQKKDGGD